MPRGRVFVRALSDLRWQVFWYGVGLALIAMMVVYVYPSYRDQLAEFELPEALKAFLGEGADYATPKGFLSAEFFSWAPILVVIFAIMQGTNLIAGEEVNGTLDLLLAQPISRGQLVVEKAAAFAAGSAGILLLAGVGWLLSVPFVEIDISLAILLGATIAILPLILVFGSFALWASVALPSRSQATGLATAIAVTTFFVDYLASLVDALRPLRWASPFHYANSADVLTAGVDWVELAVLVGLVALFLVLALRAFEGRDIGVRGGLGVLSWLRRAPA